MDQFGCHLIASIRDFKLELIITMCSKLVSSKNYVIAAARAERTVQYVCAIFGADHMRCGVVFGFRHSSAHLRGRKRISASERAEMMRRAQRAREARDKTNDEKKQRRRQWWRRRRRKKQHSIQKGLHLWLNYHARSERERRQLRTLPNIMT
jgi:hypothetical protein